MPYLTSFAFFYKGSKSGLQTHTKENKTHNTEIITIANPGIFVIFISNKIR